MSSIRGNTTDGTHCLDERRGRYEDCSRRNDKSKEIEEEKGNDVYWDNTVSGECCCINWEQRKSVVAAKKAKHT